jgi:hypothetical protein
MIPQTFAEPFNVLQRKLPAI